MIKELTSLQESLIKQNIQKSLDQAKIEEKEEINQ